MKFLTLVIITPEGEFARLECDSVTAFARDNEEGSGGGSFGIRPGHLPLLAALEKGSPIKPSKNGVPLPRYCTEGGFLNVRDDTVTVVTPGISQEAI